MNPGPERGPVTVQKPDKGRLGDREHVTVGSRGRPCWGGGCAPAPQSQQPRDPEVSELGGEACSPSLGPSGMLLSTFTKKSP